MKLNPSPKIVEIVLQRYDLKEDEWGNPILPTTLWENEEDAAKTLRDLWNEEFNGTITVAGRTFDVAAGQRPCLPE